MVIRHTTTADLDAVMEIYAQAREFMRENGNATQWPGDYPPREYIEGDITRGTSYVCEVGSEVVATFYYNIERDATYERIRGEWLDGSGLFKAQYGATSAAIDRRLCEQWNMGGAARDEAAIVFDGQYAAEPPKSSREIGRTSTSYKDCGVVHRLASRARGAGAFCVEWCFEQCGSLKIDTHENNAPMRGLLAKLGFAYCGVIWVLDGEERIAFQKVR